MKSCDLHSSASNAPPPVVCGRIVHLALASLLVLGALVLALIFFGNQAGAQGEEEQTTTQPPPKARAFPPAWAVESTDFYPHCRFGVGERYRPVMSYTVSSLNLGWYVDWATKISPPRPGGAEYVQMLHVRGSTYSPSGPTLAARIATNPGALWLIGNEPDCIYQDNVLPQEYAQAYHDAYTFIKANDPTARVSAGGIVQPTPLRMQYLDIVLATYVSLYGEPLPTDAWNMHTYILREASCAVYPDSCWGAEIPPGIDAEAGTLYTLDDTDDLDIFQQRIEQFRQWMRDRGYRDTPLLITEYGTLLPYYDPDSLYYDSEGNPFDEERARVFLYGTFDFLLTANDPDLGYPADENRLVQRWLWYSLDDTIEYGGALFDPQTLDMMQLGVDFGAYTGAILPTVDLFALDVGQMAPIPYSPASAVTITLRARISNVGNVALTQPVSVRFLDSEGHQIGSDQVISEAMAGCAEVGEVTIVWPNVAPGAHVVRAVVDPEDKVSEGSEDNNEVYGVVLVARGRAFLPLSTYQR
jgi:hypothetical protein